MFENEKSTNIICLTVSRLAALRTQGSMFPLPSRTHTPSTSNHITDDPETAREYHTFAVQKSRHRRLHCARQILVTPLRNFEGLESLLRILLGLVYSTVASF